MLVIGIAKGRGFAESLKLFTPMFSQFSLEFLSGRLPYQELIPKKLVFVLARSQDLPSMLNKKYIQAAVSNGVWFSEYSFPNTERIHTFNIKPCRLSLIMPKEKTDGDIKRICTRFPSIAARVFHSQNPSPEIIVFNGSEEAALALGFADAIIDIIETGWTIKQMKLKEISTIQHLDHGLWISKGDEKTYSLLKNLIPVLNNKIEVFE